MSSSSNVDKIKNSIFEVLINLRKQHPLSDSEIEGLAVLVSLLCNSDRDIRLYFIKSLPTYIKK